MSIMIEKQKCKGCGLCTEVCPGSLIYQGDDKKAYIRYPKDCWGCASCIKECHFGDKFYASVNTRIYCKSGELYAPCGGDWKWNSQDAVGRERDDNQLTGAAWGRPHAKITC